MGLPLGSHTWAEEQPLYLALTGPSGLSMNNPITKMNTTSRAQQKQAYTQHLGVSVPVERQGTQDVGARENPNTTRRGRFGRARAFSGPPMPTTRWARERGWRMSPQYIVVPVCEEADRAAAWALACAVYQGGVASSGSLAGYRGVTKRSARLAIETATRYGWVVSRHGRYRITECGRVAWKSMPKARIPRSIAQLGLTTAQMLVWARLRKNAARRKSYGVRTLGRFLGLAASTVVRALSKLKSLGLLMVSSAFGRFKTPRRAALLHAAANSEVLNTPKNPIQYKPRSSSSERFPETPQGRHWWLSKPVVDPPLRAATTSTPEKPGDKPALDGPLTADLLKLALDLAL